MMLTLVDMMPPSKIESGLVERLERLKPGDAASCVPEYVGEARGITRSRGFSRALARARALADESRLTAVAMLRRRPELCGCEIQAALGVTHATVSHHMRVLEEAGIVSAERRGKWIYYRLNEKAEVSIP
jgi:DNA-binding transcriptional ArsR family regulator